MTTPNDIPSILSRLVLVESGCAEWLGPVNGGGYGVTRFQGETWLIHRLVWTWAHGEIPDELYVCHSCDNRRCSNINHLFLGTPEENSHDAKEKGRIRQGTRPRYNTPPMTGTMRALDPDSPEAQPRRKRWLNDGPPPRAI